MLIFKQCIVLVLLKVSIALSIHASAMSDIRFDFMTSLDLFNWSCTYPVGVFNCFMKVIHNENEYIIFEEPILKTCCMYSLLLQNEHKKL